MRKSSGGERAWFLPILAGENSWADESAYLTVPKIITEWEMPLEASLSPWQG